MVLRLYNEVFGFCPVVGKGCIVLLRGMVCSADAARGCGGDAGGFGGGIIFCPFAGVYGTF